MFLVLGCTCSSSGFYGLGIDRLEWDALEHERYSSLGMDVLVMGYSNLMNLQVGFRIRDLGFRSSEEKKRIRFA